MPRTLLGKTCGILPLGVDSAYVTTTGLEWDLRKPFIIFLMCLISV